MCIRDSRKRLLELAREYDFMVVEDDPYGRLRYDGGHMIPLKALDNDVIYLGTISKAVSYTHLARPTTCWSSSTACWTSPR